MSHPQPRIPTSTYRLQFNRTFTFAQARAIVPYLHSLGVSDCYASPYFQARAESLHGYDITDHNKLNDAIGSREDYDAWVAELHAHGMGQVVDFVPNHMGIGEPQNLWWADVLENGPSSSRFSATNTGGRSSAASSMHLARLGQVAAPSKESKSRKASG